MFECSKGGLLQRGAILHRIFLRHCAVAVVHTICTGTINSITVCRGRNNTSQTKNMLWLLEVLAVICVIAEKYPLLNGVMQKIQMRKRRDSIIMAVVISACFILTFLFLMSS